MDNITFWLFGGAALIGVVILGVVILARRSSVGAAPDADSPESKAVEEAGTASRVAPARGRSSISTPETTGPIPNLDPADGTAQIDREALKSLMGAESSVVEQAYFLVISGEGIGRFIKLDRENYVIGRDPAAADICFLDDAISKQHARVELVDGQVVLEDLGSSNGTFVDGEPIKKAALKDGARVVLGRSTVLTLTFQDHLGEQFQKKMYESSTRDGLTGAYNKATFFDHMASEMHFAQRHGTNYCVVMMDIDHFKVINDTHGHLPGDEILVQVANVVRAVTRDEAMFVRYGGEEFILGERNADAQMGVRVAERIRAAIEGHEFDTSAGPLRVTMSLGVADLYSIDAPKNAKSLVEAADNALYQAKEAGRNQVKRAGSSQS